MNQTVDTPNPVAHNPRFSEVDVSRLLTKQVVASGLLFEPPVRREFPDNVGERMIWESDFPEKGRELPGQFFSEWQQGEGRTEYDRPEEDGNIILA